jgi:peptidoglycan/xylan/chitin deacetylase (PgdA/CDA1 family)
MGSLTCVLYHNIAEQETPFEAGIGVTTGPDVFHDHVRHYQRNYDVIDLETLLSGRLPARPLLITFDDCYRTVLTAARDVLAPAGLPAVFFINPSLVGGGVSLDNLIAYAVNTHGIGAVCAALGVSEAGNPTLRALVHNVLATCTAAQRMAVRARLAAALPVDADTLATRSPMLSLDDLRALPSLGVEIGNHTASHVHCGALDPGEYATELVTAKTDLEQMSGARVRSFSVAYGSERDLPPPVLSTLRESGHEAIFLVHARSNLVRKSPDVWYRTSFRNEPVSQLPLRLNVYPLIRTIRDRFAA